ncbi:MAG TPA: 3-dehydroquinate synthase family protein [Thermoanaerobaculia bacterium]|nr:3-dehydroquinate synthase family protein [Thermoanaerobaculia bacterium]
MTPPYRVIHQRSASYPVYAGEGLIAELGAIVAETAPGLSPALLVSSNVDALYGAALRESLPDVPVIAIPDGEQQKTLATVEQVLGEMLVAGLRRDSVAVVVGGGMAGDVGGFAASVYLRGIALIHVPTTLLAQVDSSIGGKTGVNHIRGKNLIGSFHWPRAVVSDPALLRTLDIHELKSGVFEALKSGVIGDPILFSMLAGGPSAGSGTVAPSVSAMDLGEIVRRSIDVKGTIVAADEREGDRRRLLNYGHTIGHGIEAAAGFGGITHGEAVGWGMLAANAIARKRGLLDADEAARIEEAIRAWRPRPVAGLDPAAILRAVGHDKKFVGQHQVMVLARRVGVCEVFTDITGEELRLGVDGVLASMQRD